MSLKDCLLQLKLAPLSAIAFPTRQASIMHLQRFWQCNCFKKILSAVRAAETRRNGLRVVL